MFVSFLRRLRWPLVGTAAAALVSVSVGGAADLGYLHIGVTNNGDSSATVLSGSRVGDLLRVTNTATSGETFGFSATSASNDGAGIAGGNSAAGIGFRGQSSSGVGVLGRHVNASPSGQGVQGATPAGQGVYGLQGSGSGVGLFNSGVEGDASTGFGVLGQSSAGDGVVAGSVSGFSLFAVGDADVEGNLNVTGTLTKGAGAFKIDHPQHPASEYLQHSFVESPEMMNVYNGNVTTDANGFATVRLPSYFQALNRNFRYQLTPIGPQSWDARAGVWREIQNNSFVIRTDKPNTKVSWQVTGVRHDPYALAHPIKVIVPKVGKERGTYLHPELYGQPQSRSLVSATQPRLSRLLDRLERKK